jgi:hypothetical protein
LQVDLPLTVASKRHDAVFKVNCATDNVSFLEVVVLCGRSSHNQPPFSTFVCTTPQSTATLRFSRAAIGSSYTDHVGQMNVFEPRRQTQQLPSPAWELPEQQNRPITPARFFQKPLSSL